MRLGGPPVVVSRCGSDASTKGRVATTTKRGGSAATTKGASGVHRAKSAEGTSDQLDLLYVRYIPVGICLQLYVAFSRFFIYWFMCAYVRSTGIYLHRFTPS